MVRLMGFGGGAVKYIIIVNSFPKFYPIDYFLPRPPIMYIVSHVKPGKKRAHEIFTFCSFAYLHICVTRGRRRLSVILLFVLCTDVWNMCVRVERVR